MDKSRFNKIPMSAVSCESNYYKNKRKHSQEVEGMLTTIAGVARELGCSPDHVRRMIRSGRWPYFRIGPKAMRVDPEEIKNLGRLIAQGEKERGKK